MLYLILQDIKANRNVLFALSFFALAFIFFCSLLSPLYPTNDWSDVNVYFNIGKAMMNGKVPYVDVFDHKGPFIFVLYGLGYLISNTTFIGVFLIQFVFWTFMLYAVFKSSRLFLSDSFSILVALIAPLFILSFTQRGGSAEEFILSTVVVCYYFFYKYFKNKECSSHSTLGLFIYGISTSIILFIKFNLLLFIGFPIMGIFLSILLRDGYRKTISSLLIYLGGVLIIALPLCIYFYVNGALGEVFDVYVLLNKKYTVLMDLENTVVVVATRLYKFFKENTLWMILYFVGAFYFPFKFINNKIGRISILLSALFSFLMLFMYSTFFPYYLLPLSVFVVSGLIVCFTFMSNYIQVAYSKFFLASIAVVVLIIAINTIDYFGIGGATLLRRSPPHKASFQFAEIVKKEENPHLINLSFGEGVNVFTLCNIVPSHKYFMTPNLTYEVYPEMRDTQESYVRNKDADFILLDNCAKSYSYFYELSILHENYVLIDTFINPNRTTDGIYPTQYLYKKR